MVFLKDTKLSVFILLSIVGLVCGKHIMCISICRSCVKSKKKTIHSFHTSTPLLMSAPLISALRAVMPVFLFLFRILSSILMQWVTTTNVNCFTLSPLSLSILEKNTFILPYINSVVQLNKIWETFQDDSGPTRTCTSYYFNCMNAHFVKIIKMTSIVSTCKRNFYTRFKLILCQMSSGALYIKLETIKGHKWNLK